MKGLKILVSAYACSPRRGSEPGVGWQFVEAISKYHDVWVITEKEKFKAEIEEELNKRPELCERMTFQYIPKTRHRTLRKIWPPSYYWFYGKWQKKAYILARSLCEQERFDLVHQLNMNGFREPGYLWNLGLPFVWGPVGGLKQFPWRFLASAGVDGALFHLARNVINAYQMRYLKRPRKAALSAGDGLLAATSEMRETMQRLWRVKSQVICETGRMEMVNDRFSVRERKDRLSLAWSGLHISRKGLPLLLRSLSLLRNDVEWELSVLGHGIQTPRWKRISQKLGIEQHCRWRGWLPREEAISLVHRAHVFVITSIEDATPLVTLEALSQGVPVICLNHCGFGDVVTSDCGIKIPVTSPQQVTVDIAHAVEKLWDDEEYRRHLAAGALRRAEDFSWEKKMETLNSVYSEVISGAHTVR